MGPKVKIIDTGLAVAKQVKSELKKFNLQNKVKGNNYSISTNSENQKMKKIIKSVIKDFNSKFIYFDNWH